MIEFSYYWAMICMLIVGLCCSSKALYISSYFIMEDETTKEDNEEFSVNEKDDSIATTETKGMILDTVTDTQEDRIPNKSRKVPF